MIEAWPKLMRGSGHAGRIIDNIDAVRRHPHVPDGGMVGQKGRRPFDLLLGGRMPRRRMRRRRRRARVPRLNGVKPGWEPRLSNLIAAIIATAPVGRATGTPLKKHQETGFWIAAQLARNARLRSRPELIVFANESRFARCRKPMPCPLQRFDGDGVEAWASDFLGVVAAGQANDERSSSPGRISLARGSIIPPASRGDVLTVSA